MKPYESKFEDFDEIDQLLERLKLPTKQLQTPVSVPSTLQEYCALFRHNFLVPMIRNCFKAVSQLGRWCDICHSFLL